MPLRFPYKTPIVIVALLVALIFAASACADPGAPDGPPGQSQDSPPTNLVTVTNLDDSGPGSLRAALEGAPPADPTYVQFAGDVRGIVKLEKQITVAAGKFVLDGPGTGGISLSGGDASRVLVVPSNADLTVSNLTITRGKAVGADGPGGPGEGGAILNRGDLKLDGVAITDSTAVGGAGGHTRSGPGYGGAILNAGILRIERSRFVGDAARGGTNQDAHEVDPDQTGGDAAGGAIRNEGELLVSDSEFRDDTAIGGDGKMFFLPPGISIGTEGGSGRGGAIFDATGSDRIFDSTFAGDAAIGGSSGSGQVRRFPGGDAGGGAIFSAAEHFTLWQSTVVYDRAELGRIQGSEKSGTLGAGGLQLHGDDGLLRSDTISFDQGVADVQTIVPAEAQNTIVGSCAGAGLRSAGFNLDIRGTCGLSATTDLRNVDPRFADFGDHGGSTRTLALTPASPAVDAGKTTLDNVDQRGAERRVRFSNRVLPPGGDGSDIGAYELQSVPQTHYSVDPRTLTFGSVDVGTVSKFEEVTLLNDGNVPFHIGAVTITGQDPDEFSISSQTCSGIDLAADATCRVRVRFSPEEAGPRHAAISIDTRAPGGALTVALSGDGREGRRSPAD